MKKLVLIVLLVVLVVAFFATGLHHYLSLESFKASRATFEAWRDQYALAFVLGFFAAYVAVTALSLPFATVLTLAAGALFGLFWGTVLVSFASATGASGR